MSYTCDLTTPIGQVRLIVPDSTEAYALFSDEEMSALLAMEDDSVKRTAALALETIAASTAMVQGYIKTAGLQTDGSKAAGLLNARAAMLRQQVADGEAIEDESEMFETVSMGREAGRRGDCEFDSLILGFPISLG